MSNDLVALGWTDELEASFRPHQEGCIAGRVAVEHRGAYVAYTPHGEVWAEVAGRFRHEAVDRSDFPAVGDWVALEARPGDDRAMIRAVLPRRTAFTRKEAGFRTSEQVIAANIDFVWILAAMTREVSARRVERYLAIAWESGAQPVVVLTKADLDEVGLDRVAEVEASAIGCDVHVTSAVDGRGVDDLRASIACNRTAAVLGSSGVGKSTLINRLAGEERMLTRATRGDDVGRHTTTHRELVVVPDGGLVIDTPGLREIVLWDADTDTTFSDIGELASQCRFGDCSHHGEPGCAIRRAIASGDLELERWRSFEKMQRELAFMERRKEGKAALSDSKRRWKAVTKAHRQRKRLDPDRYS